jgi:23S rRNA (cytosine1962-C5)-methyltransferase
MDPRAEPGDDDPEFGPAKIRCEMNPGDETPAIRLLPGRDGRARHGHPWIYSNEIAMDAAAKAVAPGSVATVLAADGRPLAAGFFNPHTLIAFRRLGAARDLAVDRQFFADRLGAADRLRQRLYDAPFYRLAHAEADGLPATIVDRIGDVFVVQLNAAGPDRYADDITSALIDLFAPRAVILRNDSPVRTLEGLAEETRLAAGTLDGPVELIENGARFLVDPLGGQKTGWFYDQRDNRAFVASLSNGMRVLDAYCYGGGFGIACAVAGARSVLMLDRSATALASASESARLNSVEQSCSTRQEDAFEGLAALGAAGERFDVVVVDPPPFARSRKEVPTALRGYRKLTRLAARLVAPSGILFVASCSHNVETDAFALSVAGGLDDAGRSARILRQAGAGPDHPVHPMLPESAYLKSLTLALD